MVFILRDTGNDALYILGHNNKYTLGRSRQNHIPIRDRTVSVFQAEIRTHNKEAVITDTNSHHGTQVNNECIESETLLTNGDLIKVGNLGYTFEFMRDDFKVHLDSNIASGTKEMLKLAFKEMCIDYCTHMDYADWQDSVTHHVIELVTMESLKNGLVLLYLLEKKLMVTPKFFTEMLVALEDAETMPNFYKFLPPVDEQLKSKGFRFTRKVLKQSRRSLFKNIVFISFHELGRLGNFLTECDGAVHEYNSDPVFMETLHEIFPQDQYVCVLIHGPKNARENIKACKTRLQNENWERVQKVHEDNLYLSVLQCEKIGFKPLTSEVRFANCQTTSNKPDDGTNVVGVKPELNIKPTVRRQSARWLSKNRVVGIPKRVAGKEEIEQVTSTTPDDEVGTTDIQTPAVQGKRLAETEPISPAKKVKKVLGSESSLTSGQFRTAEDETRGKSPNKKRSCLVKNPLSMLLQTQMKPQLKDSLSETSTGDKTTTVPEKCKNLSALQKKYKNLILTPVVKNT